MRRLTAVNHPYSSGLDSRDSGRGAAGRSTMRGEVSQRVPAAGARDEFAWVVVAKETPPGVPP
jgi:hypothetical protein